MIGLCCQYMVPRTKRSGEIVLENALEECNLQLGQHKKGAYPISKIQDTWIHNISHLLSILERVESEGIKSMRVSSNLFPLFDLEEQALKSNQYVAKILSDIGKFVIDKKMRLTSHPDQFVVLSSDSDSVIANSIKIFEHHSWIFDQMNLPHTPFYAINVHGGKKGNSQKLISTINNKLSATAKSRLTLENDERCYNVNDLWAIYNETGVPIVLDSHHHSFNDAGLSLDSAIEKAMSTWNVKPLTHLSNTTPGLEKGSFTERRKHSDYVTYIPEIQRQLNNENKLDIDFEFKMKNLAIFRALEDFQINL